MSVPARGSCEESCNKQIDRIVEQRQQFGQWWREWSSYRHCDNAWMREIAWEAWKAGNKAKHQDLESIKRTNT